MEIGGIESKCTIELVKAQAKEKRKNFFIGACCIAGVLLVGTICYQFIAREFTVDSLLSTILALFSIGISVLFYFKAENSSSRFYDKVYEFNSTQKALLEKIDIVLAQKFEEIARLVTEKVIKENNAQEIEQQKSNSTSEEEKARLEIELAKTKEEIESLNNKIFIVSNYQKHMLMNEDSNSAEKAVLQMLQKYPHDSIRNILLCRQIDTSLLDKNNHIALIQHGLIDGVGNITDKGVKKLVDLMED